MENNESKREVVVKCWDNCTALSVDRFEQEKEYYLTLYKSYDGNKNIWERFKMAWNIIIGKRVTDWEIILDESDYQKLRDFK